MTTWILVRHGQSIANAGRWLAGWEDVPLTPTGWEEAAAVGRDLAEYRFDRVLTTDLIRARQTTERLLEAWSETTGLPAPEPVIVPDLRERHLGEYARQSIDDLRDDGRIANLLDWTSRPPGGESHADLAARTLPAIASNDGPGTILVVSHGGVIRTLAGLLDGLPLDSIGRNRIPNAVPMVRRVEQGRWGAIAQEHGPSRPRGLTS